MTLIQPNKHSNLLNAIVIFLSVAVTGAVMMLIFIYNNTVSATHGAVALQQQTSQIQTQNSQLKSETFALLDPNAMTHLAAAQGMTLTAAPHYVTIPQWVADSQL